MMSKQIEHKAKSWEHFISGLLGSFFGVTICHPLEVARTRLNLQVELYIDFLIIAFIYFFYFRFHSKLMIALNYIVK